MMLRRFYVQQNERAPEMKMRKKERTLKTEILPPGKKAPKPLPQFSEKRPFGKELVNIKGGAGGNGSGST